MVTRWRISSSKLILLFSLICLVFANRDFYKILGVSKSATTKQIKSAYRKLAKELHPDKNKNDPTAESKFQDLGAAYEVLSDKEKRSIYDKHGEEGLKDGGAGGGDPFADFFGGGFGGGFGDFFGFGGGRQQQRGKPKGESINMPIDITLEEVYNGEFIEIVRYKPVAKPASGTRQCNCREEMKTIQLGPGRFQMVPKKVCDECPNVKMVLEERQLEMEVEIGTEHGFDETKFFGEGEPEIDGDYGDLQLTYTILPHSIYERRGNDLYTNMTISLPEALLGFQSTFTQLDGRKLSVKRDEVTWPGMKMRVKNEGMPDYRDNTRKGNLIITFDVQFPRGQFAESSDEMKEMLKELKAAGGKEYAEIKTYNGLRGY